jgi:RNA polymerase sigma-70 factor (ECF subfamily)
MVVLRFKRKALLNRHLFDAAYLERLRTGDAATEQHFCAYFSELILLKLRTRGLVALFDDVSQETFVRVLRALKSPEGLRDPGALGAFVWSVCTNVILEHGRTRKTEPLAPADEPIDVVDPVSRSPEAQLALEEQRQAVQAVIRDMTDRDREVLGAIFLNEEGRDRVCAQLGVTKEYLRVLLYRAKKEMRSRYLAATGWPAGSAHADAVQVHTRKR